MPVKNPERCLDFASSGVRNIDIWAARVTTKTMRMMDIYGRKLHHVLDFPVNPKKEYRFISLKLPNTPCVLLESDPNVATSVIKVQIRKRGMEWFIKNTKLGVVYRREDIPVIEMEQLVGGDNPRLVLSPTALWGSGVEHIVHLNF